jgi:hypothetical protein
VLWPTSRAMGTHTLLTGHRVKLPPETTTPYPVLVCPILKPSAAVRPSAAEKGGLGVTPATTIQLARSPKKAKPSAAARPSATEKGGSGGGFTDYDTTLHARALKKAKPSAAARPSAAVKWGSGVSPDYGNPTRTHAEESQAERSSQAERRGEGRFGGLPRIRHNTARPCAEETQALRPGRAQRGRGVRGSPPITTTQLARTPKKAKQSTAARPSAAVKGSSEVSNDYGNPTRTPAEEGKAERSGKEGLGGLP